jgi:trimeric autotransporter adhesin
VSSYTVPPAQTQVSNNGDMYRLVVATTLSNLSDVNCRFTDPGVITLKVVDCGIILATQFLSFNGYVSDNHAILNWTTAKETESLSFEIEKSTDGSLFSTIATINSNNDFVSEENFYSFTDPSILTGKTFYRIKMKNVTGGSNNSRTILLAAAADTFFFVSVITPFSNSLEFEVAADRSGTADATLIDPSGRTVGKRTFAVTAGINRLVIPNTGRLAVGVYFLRLQSGVVILQRSVMKVSR